MKKTILLVEDEESLIAYLQPELEFEDYQVLTATDGEMGWKLYQKQENQIDLVILDWMIAKLDGLEVLRRIRKQSDKPVIMLTARDYVGDKVAGLDSGADDYITKPFEIEELLARIRVILRHEKESTATVYQVKDLILDTKSRQVKRNNKVVQLTQREYELLLFLLKNINETLSRDELLNAVWGVDFDGQPNIVDVYVRYLRHKIDTDDNVSIIKAVRGIGYTLRDDNYETGEK
ncbi:response regulator transcription factor [Companilactobacillus huachuanensis]|uniref:Response regulator transcription factor n=1 Tax=Companilactobacillus huachuanensis TaxID=2559914 RepID=A0ABW1RNV4_9LACO|nr:response regulator transcription factor [Companilactobacillus huachuanensis]